MTTPLLSLRRITAGYRGNVVLRDISLDLAEGSLAAIIGPNGHGKTTLLRTVSGLLPLRSGEIRFGTARIDRLRPDEIVTKGVVHVPQGDMLFPEMTVLENLQMGAYASPSPAETPRRLEMVFTLLRVSSA